jgi:diphthamide synthase (EF-2-diphthine--ammonia ligase)
VKARTLLSWSSGKDSAWALHALRQMPDIDVVGLLTTVNEVADRVAMHAVRSELLRAQAAAVGLPLHAVGLPWPCSNTQYEAAMGAAIARAKADQITVMAFGDLFLEDIRSYRVDKLAGTGIEPIFPIWGIPTGRLASEMIAGGLRARLTCVDPKQLEADPCGERGEFHTFAYDGPMFRHPIQIRNGEVALRDGFAFADLLPLTAHLSAERPNA